MEKDYLGSPTYFGQPIGSAAPVAPPQPPMSRLYSALENLQKATAYTDDIHGRLCGEYPAETDDPKAGMPSGVFNQIDNVANMINAHVENIISNMTQISNRL